MIPLEQDRSLPLGITSKESPKPRLCPVVQAAAASFRRDQACGPCRRAETHHHALVPDLLRRAGPLLAPGQLHEFRAVPGVGRGPRRQCDQNPEWLAQPAARCRNPQDPAPAMQQVQLGSGPRRPRRDDPCATRLSPSPAAACRGFRVFVARPNRAHSRRPNPVPLPLASTVYFDSNGADRLLSGATS